MTFCNSGNFT